jgi:hypothetical protein
MQPSDNTSTALDLARSWATILMRSDGEVSVTEQERELQVRVVEALITSAEEVFEADPIERFPDPSFSLVTLMPNVNPFATSERERSRKEESSTALAVLRRSLWQSTVSSVPQVVSKCTEIIESSCGLLQIYQDDASAAEVLNLWRRLESRKSLALSGSYKQEGAFQAYTLSFVRSRIWTTGYRTLCSPYDRRRDITKSPHRRQTTSSDSVGG